MSEKITGLRRELSTWETLAISIAMMSPALAMSLYGGAPAIYVGRAAPLAFLFSGLAVALVGAGLVYLCRYFSHAGSVYGLTGVTLGPRAGFVSGWALLGTYLIYTPASAATAGYFATLFCKSTGIWPGADFITFTIVFLAIVYLLAIRDIKKVGQALLSIEGVSILMMVIVLVVVVVRLTGGFKGHHISAEVFSLPEGVGLHSLVLASVFGFTAFAGFEGAASLGEETTNPKRTIPKTLIIAIAGGVVFYIICVAIMSMGFGTSAADGAAFAASGGPLFDLANTYAGKVMSDILIIGGMISAFSAALATTVGGGRLVYALTRDARPNSPLARISDTGAPKNAIRGVVILALVLNVAVRLTGATGLDSAFYLGTIGTLSLLVAYAMVDLGAIRLMLRTAPSKAVIIVPAAGFLILLYVMFNQLYPAPPAPYRYFPYIVAAWLLTAVIIVVAVPGVARRIGNGLAAEEGLQADQHEDADFSGSGRPDGQPGRGDVETERA